MDPNATVHMIREAVQDGDAEEAAYLRSELREWVARGGFEPSDPTWRNA
jgi:hypothetical protein